MTKITHPFCAAHTREELGVFVKKSQIPGAGYGLYADQDFEKGDEIVEYTGETLTQDQYDDRYDDDDMGSYGIALRDDVVIDAARTDSGVARYACDYHGSGMKSNAEYVSDDEEIWIVATRGIKAGEEIFTDYGEDMHEALGLDQ